MSKIVIPFMKEKRADWIMPQKPFHAHEDDRGFDLTCVGIEEISPKIWRIYSGLHFQFPDGIDAELRMRSSVYKHRMFLSDGIGTIDHGYRGEVNGVFYLFGDDSSRIYKPTDRFAQLVIPGVNPKEIEFVEVFGFTDETERGSKGFGSTGRGLSTSGSLGILGACD
jgi:deoxyuridine 5'-triphosphate nucleotidohydrolase